MQVCEKCPNVKYESEDDVMTVHIKPGMATGQVCHSFAFVEQKHLARRLASLKKESLLWMVIQAISKCPLYFSCMRSYTNCFQFIVKVSPHGQFRRSGNDLHMDYSISLLRALTGFSEQVHFYSLF